MRMSRLFLVLLASASSLAGAQSVRPVVLVIGTGGTIGSSGDYWTGTPTRLPIEQLVRVPGIDSVAMLRSMDFGSFPSCQSDVG